MDLAKTLIRSAVRAFYDTRYAIIIDALFIHSVCHPDDLSYILGFQIKELRKLCGKLREDRLIAVHSRQEIKDGNNRPVSRDYYYIPLHTAIDSIKFRIYHLQSQVNDQYIPSIEKKDYYCPRVGCGAQWTQMEVLSNYDERGFLCQRCGGYLEQQKESEADKGGHEKLSRLMGQIGPLLRLLPAIDAATIPENDFESAYQRLVPVPRDEQHPSRATTVLNPVRAVPSKVAAQTDEHKLEISVTTNSERTAAETAAENQRKAALAAQNQLPVWHTNSTVTGELVRNEGVALITEENSTVPEGSVQKRQPEADSDVMAAYFKRLEEEQARQAREEEEEDDEDEDDADEPEAKKAKLTEDDEDEDDAEFEDAL
ncbi:MAG: hypothetical protein M1834_000687 [Cirrosporium novae-zelandiae]|nr:MAG: hypothetical protein M1834_000687 [Cirrosporium novae-zelandiae]